MDTSSTSQPITPALRRWIIEQAQAGYAAPVVLQSMRDAGWDENVAAEAMEVTLQEHLEEQAVQQGLPPAVAVPQPQLDESPAQVDCGDRMVNVLLAIAQPRIVVFGNM